MNRAFRGIYPPSEHGHFRIIGDTVTPHYYMITPAHIKHSPSMILDIESAEMKGAQCGICRKLVRDGKQGKVLSLAEHESALVVECQEEIEHPVQLELKDWLLSIKDEAIANKYHGFAFVKQTNGKVEGAEIRS